MEDLHKKWPHRWITPKAEYRKSRIHGRGLFAKKDIPKGEIVGIIAGIVIPIFDIDEYREKVGDFGVQISDDFWVGTSTKEEIEVGGAVNHSCNPNVGFKGEIVLVAMKNINEGEEFTTDYALYHNTLEPFECNCGSPNCRNIIKPDDWKDIELQENYGEYFVQYLKEKFEK